jgi:hypothetical protein
MAQEATREADLSIGDPAQERCRVVGQDASVLRVAAPAVA